MLHAAKDAGKLGIGVDSNQNGIQPGSVLTSVMKRVDIAVYNAFKDDANFKAGTDILGVKDTGVALAMDDNNKSLISADASAAVDAATKASSDGTTSIHAFMTANAGP